MENMWVQLSFALPIQDPLAGTLVWGSAGLVAWIVCAALVGVGLHALRHAVTQPPRPEACAEHHESWRDAA